MSAPVSGIAKAERRLRKALSTDEGITRFLDDLLGRGNYSYDAHEDVWVTPDDKHSGPGRGFVVIRRGGSWFTALFPERDLS
jgi:hypothetical protein